MALALILSGLVVSLLVFGLVGTAWLFAVLAPTFGKLLPYQHFSAVDPRAWFAPFHTWSWQSVGILTIILLLVLNPVRQRIDQTRLHRFVQRMQPVHTRKRADLSKLGFGTMQAAQATYTVDLSTNPYATQAQREAGRHEIPMGMSPYQYMRGGHTFGARNVQQSSSSGQLDTGIPRRDLGHLLNQPGDSSYTQLRREYGGGDSPIQD